ncbi:MAG: hypothetical protein UT42_C0047G0003 [Candidatus Falkowbacteria bacterium GW2011_GWA2_39_24]|uniref:Uncharacterized protein n=1 Tax=Candidatus Falkowbacteria bacterium GW2011_GWA2_39_24 TaxID=1618634 RepID=A0A0G0NCY0_9BACT|nr:MAG: hypothetical protein UT42_C0047G0003 [Candidatus Falkowbacteria bacterium GW2011_GWA2_39_24]
MSENKERIKKISGTSTNNAMRKLVVSRLSVLSPNTRISLGSDGSFTRDELIVNVEKGNKVGEKIIEIEMEWLRSFKEKVTQNY